MPIESRNPATGKLLKSFKPTSARAVEAALQTATRAFASWKSVPVAARARHMRRAATVLRRGAKRYARLMALEMGKPVSQGLAEVEKCAWACEHFAASAPKLLAPQRVVTEAHRSYVRFEPMGVVLAVMPWNFPFWQVFRFAAPALMAGNVGILKHASNVPQCALAIEQVFRAAGFPKGVLQTLLITPAVIPSLVADERVAAVTLTGSESAGREVAGLAGSSIKKTVLELGGSDPFIVLKDADVERAAAAAASSRTVNTGQSCIAAKRFIVEAQVAKRFTKLFTEAMGRLVVGNPLDSATQVGPLARADLRDELVRQVRGSVRRGAKIVIGGRVLTGPGYFYAPTVLANVKPGMPTYHEEVFGPVASVIVVRSATEAVRVANSSPFGLGANVWTRRITLAERMAGELAAGFVAINDFVKSDPRLPFGGVKRSGYGRELGEAGLREFVNAKSVVVR